MPNKLIHFAEWIWQDYTGAKWSEINKANTHAPTGDSAYCTVKGKDSKSNYRPKSLFYHYQIGGIDSSKYKLNSVTFTLVLGRKCSNKVNPLPSIKCFVGDNNAPYRKEPLCTVSTYSLKKLEYDFDTYIIEYKLSNVTIADLKNLIVEVDWKRSLINGDSTVRVNRARVNVDYELKTPKWSIYDWMAEDTFWDNETTDWKITAKNTGYKGDGEVDIVLPKGVTLVSSRGEGSFNSSTLKWTFNAKKGETRSRYFKLKFTTVGDKTLTAKNVKNPVNKKLTRDISVIKSQPKPVSKDDTITYTVYDYFAKEEWQYFDVQINGVARNHPTEIACFPISMTPNCTLYTPLVYPNVYLLSESSDTVYQISGSYNDRICLRVEPNEDFEAHLRIFFKCDDSSDTGTVYMTANGTIFSKEFPINPPRKNIFIVDDSENISRDKSYVVNSVNIGATDMWTIRSKFSRHNFFDDKKDLMEIEIEKEIAYIGVIPLSRCHKADVTADSKNSLIENRYLNRAYYGKKGDYSEDIKMTLRIPWYDVATLQGLVEMDKPIPIDTIPHFPDGDPLNHRGWAEIYEVTNIKKINDLYYECDVGVKYLSHDINTRFSITEAKKITEANIKYYLALIHNYNEDLLDIFTLNYYEFWTTLEDANGDMIGTYDIEPQASLKMNRDLNRYSTYDIVYRNTLPMIMSEDYDGNWEMAIRVLDKSDNTMLFEHSYSNFKHYDYDTDYAVNTADATSKYLNGSNYDTLNLEKVGLGYDSLAPLIEDKKIATHFNTMEDSVISELGEMFEIFLLDSDNKGIANKTVQVKIESDENFKHSFNVMTDIWGRVLFNTRWGNGNYTVTLVSDEDETYRSCRYQTNLTIDFENVVYHFEYPRNVTVYSLNYPYTCTLLDENNDPVSNIMLHYSFKELDGENYGYERTLTTDSNGQITIPIDWTNGTKQLRVALKGFADNGVVYQPVMFEEVVNVFIDKDEMVIEADSVEVVQGNKPVDYYVTLKSKDGALLTNTSVNIAFYNSDNTYLQEATTNQYGVASVPLYLTGDSWYVDVHFKGNTEYKPNVRTEWVDVRKFEQTKTKITSTNLHLNEDEVINGTQGYYTITLCDNANNPIPHEPVNVSVDSLEGDNYIDVIIDTNDDGKIEVPFLTHNENVKIISVYQGSTRYKDSYLEDVVSFDEVNPKIDVSFSISQDGTQIFMQKGTGASEDIYWGDDPVERYIANYEDDYRTVYDGLYYYIFAIDNEYKATVFYKGNSTYYSHSETLTFEKTDDSRGSINAYIVHSGGGSRDFTYTYTDNKVDDLNHMRIDFNFKAPKEPIYIGVGYTGSENPTTHQELEESSDYVLRVNPNFYDSGEHIKTYYEFDSIVPSNGVYQILFESDFIISYRPKITMSVVATSKENVTLTQTGFGSLSQTYQEMTVYVHNNNAPIKAKVNEYYIMRLLNSVTLEEFYFYSYLIDNSTPSPIDFKLGLGTWEMDIVSKHTDGYKGAIYQTTATIDSSENIEVMDEFFYEPTNWNIVNDEDLIISDDSITINTRGGESNLAISDEFGDYNKYKLVFTIRFGTNPIRPQDPVGNVNGFLIGANPSQDPNIESWDYPYGLEDGLYVTAYNIEEWKNGILINEKPMPIPIDKEANVIMERDGENWDLYINNTLVYSTTSLSWNTVGIGFEDYNPYLKYVSIYSEPIIDITPSVDEYDGSIFGSNVHLELRDDKLTLIDYGMLPQGAVGSGNIILNDVQLNKADQYALELEITYNNTRFERLNNLTGQMQMRVYEDVSTSELSQAYAKTLCSPMPVPNAKTIFTRHSDEGILYYVQDPLDSNPYYLANAYNLYKGGTAIRTETGIFLFNLDNAHSPVVVGNELVRAEFHRRSGFIKLSRYDELSDSWYVVNILKLNKYPQLVLNKYDDDYAEVQFGQTIWKFYRGRPFIVVNHEKDDLRILNIVDRVYCETVNNELSMGFIDEVNTKNKDVYTNENGDEIASYSTFTPQLSIQQFKQDLHIGQNIKVDNFELYKVDGNGYIDELENETDATLGITQVDNENALVIYKNISQKVGLNFPSYSNYVKRVGDTFSLLVGYVDSTESSMTIKARGFDERGAVPCIDGIQYGIWEQSQTVSVDTQETDEIRVTFTDCPSEVKYLDFIITFNSNSTSEIILKDFMYYDGNSVINHDVDTSLLYAEQIEVVFDETYYANLYNEKDSYGLCIIRPYQHKFSLKSIYADKETVFVPYMKKSSEWDKPSQVFLEYLNAKSQIIDIDWSN